MSSDKFVEDWDVKELDNCSTGAKPLFYSSVFSRIDCFVGGCLFGFLFAVLLILSFGGLN